MIPIQLIGVPTCRRYQKMHEAVETEAAHLDLTVELEEINDALRLMQ